MVKLLAELTARLAHLSETPDLDGQVLLAHISGKPRSWVLAHPDENLSTNQECELKETLRQLETGVPLPYVLGKWEFYGLEFDVTPDVLIPRPETELLVEQALSWSRERGARRGEMEAWRALDVGTGCGCIAILLALHAPKIGVIATDISSNALVVARRNAEKHHVSGRIAFVEADLYPHSLPANLFSLIIANLPYIPTAVLHDLPVYGREPSIALDGGVDGLDIIRRLLDAAPRHLAQGGLLLLEIEASQGGKVLSLAREAFPEAELCLLQDLSGCDRLVRIIRPGIQDKG